MKIQNPNCISHYSPFPRLCGSVSFASHFRILSLSSASVFFVLRICSFHRVGTLRSQIPTDSVLSRGNWRESISPKTQFEFVGIFIGDSVEFFFIRASLGSPNFGGFSRGRREKMSGAGLQVNRNRGDDRFYNPVKGRRNHNHNQKNHQFQRSHSHVVQGGGHYKEKNPVTSRTKEWVQNGAWETPKPASLPSSEQVESPLSNIERFLEAITPSVQAQYLSKTTMRGWRTCDVEFQPYFMLGDLWESFREWSAYGAGVPLVLNGSDSVVQYYVPYLSGIQIYVDPSKSPVKSRHTSEDTDGDYFGRDSSSDGSSDSERERGLTYTRQNHSIGPHDISQKMDRLFLRDQHVVLNEGFSSDDGESASPQGHLLFEYLEREQPYCRETLTDKISYLALRFSELKSLRSCDLLSSSWFSVAWYPIYRIPTGPTLRDLDACFLTYHSLYTPADVAAGQAPVVIYPDEIDGIPRISLPVFGLAAYKFRGSLWTSSSGTDRELVDTLSHAADDWLRLRQVNHPDYLFFCRNR